MAWWIRKQGGHGQEVIKKDTTGNNHGEWISDIQASLNRMEYDMNTDTDKWYCA